MLICFAEVYINLSTNLSDIKNMVQVTIISLETHIQTLPKGALYEWLETDSVGVALFCWSNFSYSCSIQSLWHLQTEPF